MDILREVSDQHLSCSICIDQYTDPKQLPCLHSFCKKCLATHILKTAGGSGGVSFHCPVCRKVCRPADPDPRKVLEWVDSFPDNFFIKSLIDTFEAQQKDAAPVPVEDQLRSMSVEAETCPKHRKETVMSYCVVKKLGVCGVCLKSSVHDECAKSHLTPEEARRFAGENLQNFKHRIETLSSRVEKAERKLSSRPDELKFKKEELAIEMSQYFSELKTQINKVLLRKEKEALDELKEVMRNELSKVSEAKDETKSLSGSLTSTEQLFDKLMENRPVGALSVAETVENQIAAYERATSKVESGCNKLDITLQRCKDIGEMIENLTWGNIHVRGETGGPGHDPEVSSGPKQIQVPNSTEQLLSLQMTSRAESITTDELFAGALSLSMPERAPVDHKMHSLQPSPLPQPPQPQLLLQSQRPTAAPVADSCSAQTSQKQQTLTPVTSTVTANVPSTSQAQATAVNLVSTSSRPQPSSSGTTRSAIPVDTGSSMPVEAQNRPLYFQGGFRFTFLHDFNGLGPDDLHSASYVGICPYGQNCLIIVDRWNKKLKLVQVGGRVLLFLEFANPMEPWDVTPVSQDKVAVTCPGYSHILMIAVSSDSMDVCKYIKTVIGYSSLVHLDGDRFAAGVCKPFGSPRVDILDASSSQASILMALPASVTYPRTLDLTLDRNLLICDWSQKETSVFDPGDFRLLLRYKGSGRDAVLREPVGVTKDRKGNLYVLDRKTKKIHVVSSASGAMMAVLPLEVPSDPKVVVIVETEQRYSTAGQVLIVALGNGKLFVYDLVTP